MRIIPVFLWAATALVLFAGGMLLIFACDLSTPSLLNFGRKFCPMPAASAAFERESARRHDLETKIHEAELKLARAPRCAPLSPPPERTEVPTGPRVGARGTLEVTLWWHTKDDIDLSIDCPGGRIGPTNSQTKGPGICGDGVHDHDANRNLVNPVTDPVEHVVWQRGIPDGLYKVLVMPKRTFGPTPIKYQVQVEFEGERKICSGAVYWNEASSTGNGEYVIEFMPQHPLPACENVNIAMHKCTSSEPNCEKP